MFNVCEYVDDILHWGSSADEYLMNLENLFICLSDRRIYLNPRNAVEVEAPIVVLSTLETDLPIPMVSSSLGGSSYDGIHLPRVTTYSNNDLGTYTVVPAAP